MKIELNENKIFFNNGKSVQEIHPFWLRERVDGDDFLDKGTQQRLFDPSQMDGEIIIKKAQIKNGILEVDFNDGVNSKLDISKLETEFSNKDTVIKSIPKKKWDSTLKNIKSFEYKEDFFDSKKPSLYSKLFMFFKVESHFFLGIDLTTVSLFENSDSNLLISSLEFTPSLKSTSRIPFLI